MTVDPTCVCELLVGLGDVTVLGAEDERGGPIRVHGETRSDRPACRGCGGPMWFKEQQPVELVDLAAFGRPARLADGGRPKRFVSDLEALIANGPQPSAGPG